MNKSSFLESKRKKLNESINGYYIVCFPNGYVLTFDESKVDEMLESEYNEDGTIDELVDAQLDQWVFLSGPCDPKGKVLRDTIGIHQSRKRVDLN